MINDQNLLLESDLLQVLLNKLIVEMYMQAGRTWQNIQKPNKAVSVPPMLRSGHTGVPQAFLAH